MSADYRTAHYKGYLHGSGGDQYLHVTTHGDDALGSFSLGDIGELVQMAGQAWPGGQVSVRFVIECRWNDAQPWGPVWSAPADDQASGGITAAGASQAYAAAILEAFQMDTGLQWRLVRRTTLTADEPAGED